MDVDMEDSAELQMLDSILKRQNCPHDSFVIHWQSEVPLKVSLPDQTFSSVSIATI